MKLYVSRHGQTVWNVERRLCGRKDVQLTEEGVNQAKKLASEAADRGISVIITSPLQRAHNTAQAVAEVCGAELIVDERLLEQDFGVYEGASFDDPGFLEIRNYFAFRYPQGESFMQVAVRVYSLLDGIKARQEQIDGAVLLVTHGMVCKVIHSYFNDLTNEEFQKFGAKNASLMEYEL